MIMTATVQEVWSSSLLVRDHATSQEVIALARNAGCFSPGDRVRIWYNGAMTNSLPPQISAIRIRRISSCGCLR